VPASTILVFASDAASGDIINAALSGVGYTVTVATNPDDGFTQVAEHQLVILDLASGERTALDVCREIRATPALAGVPVMCISQTDEVEERITFLEAGADDVLAKPFDGRELEARVEALLLRFQRSKNLAPVATSPDGLSTLQLARRLVVVYSPKGGTGTTTIATNIAAAIAQRKPERVILVDLNLQFGQAATHLNITPRQTLADAVRDDAAMREPELLRTYATRHESGLFVLPAPASPELADMVTPRHVEAILTGLVQVFDAVIVDAGSYLDERVLIAFEKADAVVLNVYPEMAALKAMHTLLDYLNEAGSVGAKATFVLNNMFAKEILKLRDVESALGTKVTADLPYDTFLYLKAVNEGVPVVQGAPRSIPAERLVSLANNVFGEDGQVAAAQRADRRPSRFGRVLRRT
jgi:pilus assembly protein CpaE